MLEIVVNCCYCMQLLKYMESSKIVLNDSEHSDYQIREVIFSLVDTLENEPSHP